MGSTDIPLNPKGIEQACLVSKILHNHTIKKLFYSPLSRAYETARIINQDIQVSMYPINELKEWCWGNIEGVEPEIEHYKPSKYLGKTLDEWAKIFYEIKAESEQNFLMRVRKGLNKIIISKDLPLVVSHGGVFKELCKLLNCQYEPLDNCTPILFSPFISMNTNTVEWQITNLKI